MRMAHTLISSLAVVLNFIELSRQFECLPNGDPLPGVPRREPTRILELNSTESTLPSAKRHFSEKTISLVGPTFSAVQPPAAEPSLRARPRSSYAAQPVPQIFGIPLGELTRIRLIPNKNPNRIFQLRRYTFPSDNTAIHTRIRNNIHKPMPTEEQIVLSTSNGDIYAIFKKDKKHTSLQGIYTHLKWLQKRAKLNMYTGAVDILTPEEISDTSLLGNDTILKNFRVELE